MPFGLNFRKKVALVLYLKLVRHKPISGTESLSRGQLPGSFTFKVGGEWSTKVRKEM